MSGRSNKKTLGMVAWFRPGERDKVEAVLSAARELGLRPLDFHSPHGCSKGAAAQYVIDYARTFSLPACVFRMSCIYGPRQFGSEDLGWVAHFLIRAIESKPITIYGDGKQVRDVLYVDDLVEAFEAARARIGRISGQMFNVGGGPATGWRPKVAPEQGIERFYDWLLETRGRSPVKAVG